MLIRGPFAKEFLREKFSFLHTGVVVPRMLLPPWWAYTLVCSLLSLLLDVFICLIKPLFAPYEVSLSKTQNALRICYLILIVVDQNTSIHPTLMYNPKSFRQHTCILYMIMVFNSCLINNGLCPTTFIYSCSFFTCFMWEVYLILHTLSFLYCQFFPVHLLFECTHLEVTCVV